MKLKMFFCSFFKNFFEIESHISGGDQNLILKPKLCNTTIFENKIVHNSITINKLVGFKVNFIERYNFGYVISRPWYMSNKLTYLTMNYIWNYNKNRFNNRKMRYSTFDMFDK